MYKIKFYLKSGLIIEQVCQEYEFTITPITGRFIGFELTEMQGQQLKYLNVEDVSAVTCELFDKDQ